MKWVIKEKKSRKRKWLMFLLPLTLCCACSTKGEQEIGPEIEMNLPKQEEESPLLLKLATTKIPESDAYQGLEQFKEQVERNSGGSIEVQLYPSEQLGDQITLFEGLGIGTVEMAYLPVGSAENIFPEVASIGRTFSGNKEEELSTLYQSETGREILEQMCQVTNIRTMGFSVEGVRNIWSKDRLEQKEDFEGIRLWISETPTLISAFQDMGVSVSSLPIAQIYDGLQAGLLDGMEMDSETALRYNLQECCKYCLETQHTMAIYTFFMSDEVYQAMTPKQQEIVQEAAEDVAQWIQERCLENRETIREELELKGVVFYQPAKELKEELKGWIRKAADVYSETY